MKSRLRVQLQGWQFMGPGFPGEAACPGSRPLACTGLPGWDAGPCGPELGVGCRTEVILGLLPAKKFKKVTGKEIYSDTLESTPMLEKEKFPQDYFPEVGHCRGGQHSAGPGPQMRHTPRQDVLTPVPRCRAPASCSAGGPDPVGLAGWPRVRAGGPMVDTSR